MVNEMAKAIGKIGNINQGGLNIDVKILDAKRSYGGTRYLVTPMAGCDSVWVYAKRVKFADKENNAGCDKCGVFDRVSGSDLCAHCEGLLP